MKWYFGCAALAVVKFFRGGNEEEQEVGCARGEWSVFLRACWQKRGGHELLGVVPKVCVLTSLFSSNFATARRQNTTRFSERWV